MNEKNAEIKQLTQQHNKLQEEARRARQAEAAAVANVRQRDQDITQFR